MSDPRRELSTHITKAIRAIQNVMNDSGTPVMEAIQLLKPLRRLQLCRRELDGPAAMLDADTEDYTDAITKLAKVGSTLKYELAVHSEYIAFVALSADAASAALKLTARAST